MNDFDEEFYKNLLDYLYDRIYEFSFETLEDGTYAWYINGWLKDEGLTSYKQIVEKVVKAFLQEKEDSSRRDEDLGILYEN